MAGILFSCKNDIEEIKALTDDRDLAVQMVEDGVFYYTSKGKLTNRLEAAHLERFESEENARIEVSGGFTLTLFDSLEREDGILKAMKGTFWDKETRLVASEDVELQNKEGDLLETEELIFVQDSDLVYTDKHVTITTKEAIIRGKGLITDSQFKKRQIKKVTGTLYIDDPIQSDTLNGSTQNP